nr:anthrone oxygenase family protein [Mesorhizobium escarrei]
MKAGSSGDPDAMAAIQHPYYLGNAPNNRVVDGEAVRSLMASGAIASDSFDRTIERIAITENVGVVMGRETIEAMQAMNASVRNAVFFPAFFLTPVVLGLTAAAMRFNGRRSPAFWFAAAALVYLKSGLFLTLAVNVPMNEALAAIPVPKDIETAREIWQDYSGGGGSSGTRREPSHQVSPWLLPASVWRDCDRERPGRMMQRAERSKAISRRQPRPLWMTLACLASRRQRASLQM